MQSGLVLLVVVPVESGGQEIPARSCWAMIDGSQPSRDPVFVAICCAESTKMTRRGTRRVVVLPGFPPVPAGPTVVVVAEWYRVYRRAPAVVHV
uniref:Putative secreted protein n=1 Tax=Anopheles darlingi TaxID=43151 RepID=A0A2M4DCY4_ANODA